jgi:hypothetical protein
MNTNMVVAGSAVFISACALAISVQEVRIMRVQQKASMYPYVTVDKVYNSQGYGFRIKNTGNGLAKINTYQIFNDSLYFKEWMDVAKTLAPEVNQIDYEVIKTAGDIRNQMLPPGEVLNLLFLNWTPETRKLETYLKGIDIRICYSSLLEENWLIEDGTPLEINAPCKSDSARDFGFQDDQ